MAGKYDRGPYFYVATSSYCSCPKAIQPKANGRILAEWVKAGAVIRTLPADGGLFVGVCLHKPPNDSDREALLFVAEDTCGCCVSVQQRMPDQNAVAKVIQVWAEAEKFIQSLPASEITVVGVCPHHMRQATLIPLFASADTEGDEEDFDDQ